MAKQRWATQYPPIRERLPNGQWAERPREFEDIRIHPERLEAPLKWKTPRVIFVNSVSDLFHDEVSDEFIGSVFAVMALADHHIFQVLTKRPTRMVRWIEQYGYQVGWPLSNVWMGVSVEKASFQWRIDRLCEIDAAVRFVSAEPLLGPLDVTRFCYGDCPGCGDDTGLPRHRPKIDWLIVGGESGNDPLQRARWMVESCIAHETSEGYVAKPENCVLCRGTKFIPREKVLPAVRELRDWALESVVPFFFKAWGGPISTSGGDVLDGKRWQQWPSGRGGMVDRLSEIFTHELPPGLKQLQPTLL